MKFLLALICIPFFSFAQSNDQLLIGKWVKTNAQMKDGSRIVDRNGCGMDFLKYNFAENGTVNLSSEAFFDGFKVNYKLGKDSLLIGETLFNLVALTEDTLKLSFFAPSAEDGQLPVYYFTRIKSIFLFRRPVIMLL